MANPEHLKLLTASISEWNVWRAANSDVRPDLSQADLRGVSFVEREAPSAELLRDTEIYGAPDYEAQRPELSALTVVESADLSGANLRGADLDGTDLVAVNLSGADLSGASVAGAYMATAQLAGTIARGAKTNFMDTDLSRAQFSASSDFTDAILAGAYLSSARLAEGNFSGANLSGAYLDKAQARRARFHEACFDHSNLSDASFGFADLSHASLRNTTLTQADFRGANLSGACLEWANLSNARLGRAQLASADLRYANVVEADFRGANLTGCSIYGVSAWGLRLSRSTRQHDLVITERSVPEVRVDHIEVAQLVYLLMNNERIRDVIDTVGKKGVLLLGRFAGGRLAVLERLRHELRKRGFVPMVFSFERPETRDFTETVRLLAGMAHFVIVDITNPRSTPLELNSTVPECMVPFVPILDKNEEPFAMFRDLWIKHNEWMLKPIRYPSVDRLVEVLDLKIIQPAEEMFARLIAKKAAALQVEDI